jgi:hypothetical protein
MLRCEICGIMADDHALGWRAYLASDDDEGVEVVVFCPTCAEREFGPQRAF